MLLRMIAAGVSSGAASDTLLREGDELGEKESCVCL